MLHLDDFHNLSTVRGMGGSPVDAYYQNAFNYGKLIRKILAPLREKGRLDKTVTCLDLDTDEYRNRVTYRVEEDVILLIEGVLLFRPPVRSFLNGTIFWTFLLMKCSGVRGYGMFQNTGKHFCEDTAKNTSPSRNAVCGSTARKNGAMC